ncbi:RNA-directed DNA polymerase, eukaryota, reverse transcriptase zinc-binding domain protein [Tanacetum coccineum]
MATLYVRGSGCLSNQKRSNQRDDDAEFIDLRTEEWDGAGDGCASYDPDICVWDKAAFKLKLFESNNKVKGKNKDFLDDYLADYEGICRHKHLPRLSSDDMKAVYHMKFLEGSSKAKKKSSCVFSLTMDASKLENLPAMVATVWSLDNIPQQNLPAQGQTSQLELQHYAIPQTQSGQENKLDVWSWRNSEKRMFNTTVTNLELASQGCKSRLRIYIYDTTNDSAQLLIPAAIMKFRWTTRMSNIPFSIHLPSPNLKPHNAQSSTSTAAKIVPSKCVKTTPQSEGNLRPLIDMPGRSPYSAKVRSILTDKLRPTYFIVNGADTSSMATENNGTALVPKRNDVSREENKGDNGVKKASTNDEKRNKNVDVKGKKNMMIIAVYAPQESKEKQSLWDFLHHEIGKWNGDVIIMGDFNEVRVKSDRFGSHFNPFGAQRFNSFISDSGLVEVNLGGCHFTWCHKSATKMSKLDRFLVSESVLSDMDGFNVFVENTWKNSPRVGPNALSSLMSKLRILKQQIRSWNKFGRRKNEQTLLKKKLEDNDLNIDSGLGNEDLINSRLETIHQLQKLDSLESMERAQKVKIKWAVEGDENTGFFHGIINKRRNIQSIRGVMVEGKWIDNPVNISYEQRAYLESDVTNAEIKKAVWECGIDKAPGPDGFTFGFFRHFWYLVDIEVFEAVSPTEEFQFGKCLKQGDPLSPFLFLLVMETLHISFQRVVNAGMYQGIKVGGLINLSHMFYADDAVFVGEWSESNISSRIHVHDCFHKVSGLKINMSKSKLMGIEVEAGKVSRAAVKLGCLVLKTPFLYLGSYVAGDMHIIQSWEDIVDRVRRRLSKWKIKMLSIGGRLTLIKSVLGSMPIFHMSMFKFPTGILRILESIRGKFFNGHETYCKKASWVQWNKVLAPKVIGGLGIPSLYALNRGLLFKWVWRFFAHESTLWSRVVKAIHGDDGNIDGVSRKGGKFKERFPRALENLKRITVGSKLTQPCLTHSFRRIPRGGLEESQVEEMSKVVQTVDFNNSQDKWSWSLNTVGEYTVASARYLIDVRLLSKGELKTRWIRYVPIKVNTFAWKVMMNSIPTRFNISRRRIDIESLACVNCDVGIESTNHFDGVIRIEDVKMPKKNKNMFEGGHNRTQVEQLEDLKRQHALEKEEQRKEFETQQNALKIFVDFFNRQQGTSSSQFQIPDLYTPQVFPGSISTPGGPSSTSPSPSSTPLGLGNCYTPTFDPETSQSDEQEDNDSDDGNHEYDVDIYDDE